jgi:hypothetical protein
VVHGAGCVQDFSENLIIEVAMENQSKHYHNISVTLFGLCGYFWIDDCKDSFIPKEGKMMMKAECEKKTFHILSFLHGLLSAMMVATTKHLCSTAMDWHWNMWRSI